MTPTPAVDWNATEYAHHSGLQEAMAAEVLGSLVLGGDERVLDVGCGDGRLSARIADRVPRGAVLGVDASADMIAFADAHFARGGSEPRTNLAYAVVDARALEYRDEFDLVVSFNALHWIPEQADALRGIAAALRAPGRAVLRLVVKGAHTSLEEIAEATRRAPRWARYFEGFADPYLRLDAEQYAALAERQGLRALDRRTRWMAWDFETHAAFFGFCRAGSGAWTRRLPEADGDAFIEDVLAAYRTALGASAAQANLFRFYQMDIALARRD